MNIKLISVILGLVTVTQSLQILTGNNKTTDN